MGQSVHIEIEVLVSRNTNKAFKCLGSSGWCWVMSYSPNEKESYGFNALLGDIRPLPSNLSEEVLKKFESWKHQHTTWWCYLEDFLVLLDDPDTIPCEVREWYLSWASLHLGGIAPPNNLRIVVWITEGMYD